MDSISIAVRKAYSHSLGEAVNVGMLKDPDSNISPQEYKSALELSKRGKLIIYKRNPTEIQINSYNKHLLRAWEANLDVQYCLDPYACIAYMVAYITKDEREMSQILQAVSNEANTLDFKSSMKNSNFSTVYVPADKPEKRICLLKPISSVKDKEAEDEDVYQTSILDRYAARPTKLENLCLAKFSIWYTFDNSKKKVKAVNMILNQLNNTASSTITLKIELGQMRKTRKPAILKYHKYSELKEKEDYSYSQLLLNRQDLEHHEDIIEEALDQFESIGPPEHSWDTIAPQCCENLALMDISKKKSDPLRMFISNGPGTGKSHSIFGIYQMALRKLQTIGDNPDDVHFLLTASAGTAAHNISVLAFEDLFHLPPVMQQFVFKPSKDPLSRMCDNLWDDFSLYELTDIMRQKDDFKFTELLNRIRNATFTNEDIEVLKRRGTTIHSLKHPIDCLHVYSTNAKVDQHNTKMLSTSKEPMDILKAVDKKPHDFKKINPKNDPRFTDGLPDEITVAVGPKIMLTRNVDVTDGLVNGAQGTIKMIMKRRNNSSTISNVVVLLVQFVDANTGSKERKQSRFPVENKRFSSATPIALSEISFTLS
ncbi:unnamed protein product [Mytilus edulis]|uniref:DNA helicase Pif1-like 2B domain-containing protein n=1 Tax=Mytilus edulis TaxID=6550 RepID=A0A8S3QN37_MYTED|nr:unnamed protein product [Mytilus edulis]